MKKVFLAFGLLAYCLLLIVPKVAAQTISQPTQTPTNVNPYMVPNTAPGVPQNLHTFVPALMDEVMASMVCVLSGTDPITRTNNCLGVTPNGKLGFVSSKGLIGTMSNSIDSIYQNGFPFGTGTYIAYLQNNFGVVPHAYAAFGCPPPPGPGQTADQSTISGFCGFSPLLSIWVVIRNFAYLLMVIAFMGIGIAIMLRVKIDPRTVMTIENQLPKLVIGLLLITFSLAIAGVMADTMKLLDGVIFNVYSNIQDDTANGITFNNKNVDWKKDIQNSNPWDAVRVIVPPINNGKTTPLKIQLPSFSLFPDHIGPVPLDFAKIPAQSINWQIPFGFGSGGVNGLALDAAESFSNVLTTFFKITPDNVNYIQDFVPIIGPILLITHIIGDVFTKGSPVGIILDFVSFTLALSWSNGLFNSLAQSIGKTCAVGNCPGIIGFIVTLGLRPAALGLFYSLLDITIKNFVLPIIIWLVVYIAVFLAMARLFFSLVFAWATILFEVVIGPLMIVFGLIPGLKGGFTGWLKTLAANLMAFPITIGILLLGSALVQAVSAYDTNGTNVFIPPLVGGGILPVGLLLAVAVIFAASNGPQIAKDLFEEKDNKNYGAFGATSGSSLQMMYKAGKATMFGFGKTPQPGTPGGIMTASQYL